MHTPNDYSSKPKESFFKKQAKLAFSTFNVATIATFSVTFWINIGIMTLVLFFVVLAVATSGSESEVPERTYSTIYGNSSAEQKLLSIPIRGPIEGSYADADYATIFADPSIAYGYDLQQEIQDAADSGAYAGLILEINSPGGTIYGSKAIADAVEYFKKKTQKPVYASVQGMAASGAYWAASSADKIIADSGTGTGSIGVLYGPFVYYDKPTSDGFIITENGVEVNYITAGESKDVGNPFRRLTDQEKSVIQVGVNDAYDDFVAQVNKGRGIDSQVVRSQIGAHLYGEKQAIANKLVDGIGNPEFVYNELAKAAGIQGSFKIVSSHSQPAGLSALLGVYAPNSAHKTKKVSSGKSAQVCTGAVSVPLAYHGEPAHACKN